MNWAAGIPSTQGPELIRMFGGHAEMSGFTFTGCQLHLENGSFNIHDNTFRDSYRGIFIAGLHDTHIDHNTFLRIRAEGIYGYPGGDNATFDNNNFDYVWEPVHFGPGSGSNYDVSGNRMTHTTRYGIELQSHFNGIRVNNNYAENFLANIDHIALSLAYNPGTVNAECAGNVLIKSGPDQSNLNNTSAIEAAGSDFNIHDNYIWNWGNAILNGTQRSYVSSNNVFVGCAASYSNDGTPWAPVQPSVNNDRVFGLHASNAPAWPAPPSGAPTTPVSTPAPVTTPVSTPAPPPVTTPVSTPGPVTTPAPAPTLAAPTNLTAASPSGSEIDISWTDKTGGTAKYKLERRATHGTTDFQTIATLDAGATSFQDTNVAAQWEYEYRLTAVNSTGTSDSVTTNVQAQMAVTAPVVSQTPTPVSNPGTAPTPVVGAPHVVERNVAELFGDRSELEGQHRRDRDICPEAAGEPWEDGLPDDRHAGGGDEQLPGYEGESAVGI